MTLDEEKIQIILNNSLSDPDFFSKKSIRELLLLGLDKKEALALLSQFKSKIVNRYSIVRVLQCQLPTAYCLLPTDTGSILKVNVYPFAGSLYFG